MKVRAGFVSNSSSSSFIIAIGKVIDRVKFETFLKDNIDMRVISDLKFYSPESIQERTWDDIQLKNKKFEIEAFSGASVQMDYDEYIAAESKKNTIERAVAALAGLSNDDILIWNWSADEGDGSFMMGGDDDIDYDIDMDFFEEDVRKLYDGLTEENGIVLVDKSYGAGRNG